MTDTLILKDFTGDVLLAPDAEAIKTRALATAKTVTAVTDETGLKLATVEMKALKSIVKTVEDQGMSLRRPVNELAAKIKDLADDYVLALRKEHDRIQGLSNHFLELQRREARERELEAQREAERASRAAQEAQEALQKAEALRLAGNTKEAEKLEEKALDLELQAETASLQIATVEPVKVAGLTVREKINFQVVDPLKFLGAFPRMWKASENKEELKVRRADVLDFINTEGACNAFERDADGLPIVAGCRLFYSVKGYTR